MEISINVKNVYFFNFLFTRQLFQIIVKKVTSIYDKHHEIL